MNKDQESGRKASRTHHLGTCATEPVSCRGGTGAETSSQGGKAVENKVQMTSMASELAVWAEAGLSLAAVNPVTPPRPWNSLSCNTRAETYLCLHFSQLTCVQESLPNPNQKPEKRIKVLIKVNLKLNIKMLLPNKEGLPQDGKPRHAHLNHPRQIFLTVNSMESKRTGSSQRALFQVPSPVHGRGSAVFTNLCVGSCGSGAVVDSTACLHSGDRLPPSTTHIEGSQDTSRVSSSLTAE